MTNVETVKAEIETLRKELEENSKKIYSYIRDKNRIQTNFDIYRARHLKYVQNFKTNSDSLDSLEYEEKCFKRELKYVEAYCLDKNTNIAKLEAKNKEISEKILELSLILVSGSCLYPFEFQKLETEMASRWNSWDLEQKPKWKSYSKQIRDYI